MSAGLLSGNCRGIGPHHALRGESPGVLRQEAMGSLGVAMGPSGNLLCCLREVKSPFELQGALRDSSPVTEGE